MNLHREMISIRIVFILAVFFTSLFTVYFEKLSNTVADDNSAADIDKNRESLKRLFIKLENEKHILQNVNRMKEMTENKGYLVELRLIKNIKNGTFVHANKTINILKNRDLPNLCYDHNRVILSTEDNSTSDFINANYVDGYYQKNAFILTQG
jgi:protein tyrosine phosphatase